MVMKRAPGASIAFLNKLWNAARCCCCSFSSQRKYNPWSKKLCKIIIKTETFNLHFEPNEIKWFQENEMAHRKNLRWWNIVLKIFWAISTFSFASTMQNVKRNLLIIKREQKQKRINTVIIMFLYSRTELWHLEYHKIADAMNEKREETKENPRWSQHNAINNEARLLICARFGFTYKVIGKNLCYVVVASSSY